MYNAAMKSSNRSEPMVVKYWSRAGLMLTDGCNAACAGCYLRCRPGAATWMSADMAVGIWAGLTRLSPHGCRVHVTGGEPFLDWARLIEILRAAAKEGLFADSVETNGAWAMDDAVIRERLEALDAAGMRCLAISADPFHQEFVPIDRVRRLAEVAVEALGPDRVRVRWEDWLRDGRDVQAMTPPQRDALFREWIATGRDRLNGRAAEKLADALPLQPAETFAGQNCRESILRSRHVHIGPDGNITPGVCAGLSIGKLIAPWEKSVSDLWHILREDYAHSDCFSRGGNPFPPRQNAVGKDSDRANLNEDAYYSRRPILSRLIENGPTALLSLALKSGLAVPQMKKNFASKCHLCWSVRTALAVTGDYADELSPPELYRPD
jgi:organic radical activating enzyme